MITELAVERVEFTCGSCRHRWSVDYDVRRYRDTLDDETPRSRVLAEGGHRPGRPTAPMLHAAGHPQPQPSARAGQAPTKPSG
ncbi:hypothetical protein [Streptomyces sp. NPDC005799]|uniref:hypothetical protein n=1 Tax=Streptomyces sp. NPDC005799 TaxID=3154678 RepID=UPI0033D51CDC